MRTLSFALALLLALVTSVTAQPEWLQKHKIDMGFSFHNASIVQDGSYLALIGKMANQSGEDYTAASFSVSFYDKDQKLVAVKSLILQNFPNGRMKTFKEILFDLPETATRFEIEFDSGF